MKPINKIKPVIKSLDKLNGAITVTKKFSTQSGSISFDYSAARNEEFVTILLGSKIKGEGITQQECIARLLILGFLRVDDIDEILGKEKTDELIDALNSKYKKMFEGVEE